METYLVVKCEELHDQYECDVNRTPLFLSTGVPEKKYFRFGYEIYVANDYITGRLKRIKEYDEE